MNGKKEVLVTGGRGFVGANLVRRLLVDDHNVNLLLRPNGDNWRLESILSDLAVHSGDVCSAEDVSRIVAEVQPQWIFHLATYGAYSWQTDIHRIMETNIIGLLNLMEAAQQCGIEAFVNVGSSSEYGFKDHAPTETESLEPNSDYAVAKAAVSMLCRSLARRTEQQIVTVRLYSAYGPYEEPNRLIPQLVVKGLEERLPPLVSPEIARDFVYIDDVVEALIRAAQTTDQEAGAIYNLGSGIQTSIRDMV